MQNTTNTIIKNKPGTRGKDKQKRKQRTDIRPDLVLSDNEKSSIMKHNMELFALPKIDCNNPHELQTRITDYFCLCNNNGIFPSIAGFACSLKIDRKTLWTWLNGTRGTIKNPVCVDILKETYNLINSQYEDMLSTGKINPVAAIFLMKNNFGYKDQTDHVLTAKQEITETEESLIDRAGLLTD